MTREKCVKKVIKRNDEIVAFDQSKITSAIAGAMKAVGEDEKQAKTMSNLVMLELVKKYHGRTIPAVEAIQDVVEQVLMQNDQTKAAKAYILYRDRHKKIRDAHELVLDIQETMDGYLKQNDWRVNENSNVNYSLGGLILHNSGTITANYWLKNIYPEEVANAHRDGDFHIHDLSMFSGYCAGWSLRQLLLEGLGGVRGKINSRPPRHLSTAVNQMINFLGTMQNEWAGAQAFSSFDTFLAPFVIVDNMEYKQVKQCIQSFVFSMNTPSRWGSQSPFTNITLDWVPPHDLADKKVVVGGEELDFTYADCQEGMDMINKAFIEVMMEGDADGRGFSYPIPTYNITRDFDWDTENANLLFKMTAQFGTPYFQNFINSDLDPSDVRSMCCRLQLDKRELRNRGGGLFGADEFTGSIGVVTINLPRLGYLSKTREEFYRRLDDLMDKARDSLEIKRRIVNNLMDQGLFPYTKRYLKHLNNHFSTIGINGMHECCLNFLGKPITDDEGLKFSEDVLVHMRERLADYQELTGNLYNLEATPAEGTSYRLARQDRKRFKDIIQSGIDEPFYTNSTHLPVDYTEDIFAALDLQDRLQTKYTGGTVLHGFLGESIQDVEVCKNLVRKIASGYKLPFFSISPSFTVCEEHGRMAGEHFKCPQCDRETEVYSRIVGYYRPVHAWNKGKKEEFKHRKTYTLDEGTRVVANETPKFKFFYSDNCTKCPPVKEYIKDLGIKGDFINVSVPKGLEQAQTYNVRSLPSVIFLDGEAVTGTAQTVQGIRECLSRQSSASL
jgi:anaerobic ribonucleoside-triphosphate reductase